MWVRPPAGSSEPSGSKYAARPKDLLPISRGCHPRGQRDRSGQWTNRSRDRLRPKPYGDDRERRHLAGRPPQIVWTSDDLPNDAIAARAGLDPAMAKNGAGIGNWRSPRSIGSAWYLRIAARRQLVGRSSSSAWQSRGRSRSRADLCWPTNRSPASIRNRQRAFCRFCATLRKERMIAVHQVEFAIQFADRVQRLRRQDDCRPGGRGVRRSRSSHDLRDVKTFAGRNFVIDGSSLGFRRLRHALRRPIRTGEGRGVVSRAKAK